MIPKKTIEELITRHSSLEKDLASGNVDKNLFAEKSKEYSDLNEIVYSAKKYASYKNDKIELEKILNDKNSDEELMKMAHNELSELNSQFEKNEKKLKLLNELYKNQDSWARGSDINSINQKIFKITRYGWRAY